MRYLTLVRHGKSSWDYDGLQDYERPLNRRGQKDVPAMALRFVGRGHRPDYLLSSFATRALTTARMFARQLHHRMHDGIAFPVSIGHSLDLVVHPFQYAGVHPIARAGHNISGAEVEE